MRIWTRKSASIQPRTSRRKSDCEDGELRQSAMDQMARHQARSPGPVFANDLLAGLVQPHPEARSSRLSEFCQNFVKFQQNFHNFWHPIQHFSAFFEIYKKIIFPRANFAKFCQNFGKILAKSSENFCKFCQIQKKFCKILQNLLARR